MAVSTVRALLLLRFVVLTCALLGSVSHVAADQRLQVDTWTVAQGLPQDTVTAITQDSRGYLWVATRKGLARFDGLLFRTIGVVEGVDLSTLRLTALAAADDGGVWVGTYAAGLLHLHERRVRRYGTNEGIPDGTIWDVRRDSRGRMWAATTEGMRYLEDDRWVAP